ncbi:CBS domain containing-hemolysin-like protein [Nocardioides ginsengisegetis]|uniref:CBS domain containing-hemolysin-like protein n=1 Tax=Nocardioides ginsengisegetis TaxID=661491 RepID=A0A7W3IZ66_9ACTN|nr:hemolysin family protein [Nocardioides ginsengisegetis]MBA8803327.1 CBS domain containing-hemolysin-like protein [Nocardioides ginsengisegetis]
MSSGGAIVVAILLLLGNAFFVAAEFALVSARRTQIEPRAEAGNRFARTTLRAMENISLVIGVNQLGITVCSLVLGAVGEPAVSHLLEPVLHAAHVPEGFLHPVAFTGALAIVVYLHVVMGEMIPKNIALAGPDRAALVLGTPIWAIVTVLRPVIIVINAIAAAFLRLVGVRLMDEVSSTYTREEVAAMVEESRGEGLLEADEYDRLAGALGFTEKNVTSVLMPPDTLTTVARGASGADVEAICAATGFSRFPVAGDGGELLGYLHIKDVLEPDEERRERPLDDKWIRPFAPVTSDDTLHEALETLQRRGAHMARVVDAEGTTIGLATLEDVIEELVGEIRDAAHLEEPV